MILEKMILSTTSSLEGFIVEEYLGVVTSEMILSGHVGLDISANISNFLGNKQAGYSKKFRQSRDEASNAVKKDAIELGANAIIGIQIDYEITSPGDKGSMMMCAIIGTAVRIRKLPANGYVHQGNVHHADQSHSPAPENKQPAPRASHQPRQQRPPQPSYMKTEK